MILVTGTDTGVGKTFVTVSILKYMRNIGRNICALKIVETGCRPICEDARKISAVCKESIDPIYSFKTPVAPSVATEIENKEISIEKIKERILSFSKNYEETLFEGAGGLLVPIKGKYTFLDLTKELNMEVLVVALNKLGVINHTLLTVKVCQLEGVNVKGVILNHRGDVDESSRTNYKTLKDLLNVPVYFFSKPEDVKTFVHLIFPE
ncbi:dethiobiotin synthase [Desulfurobacterium thermolithotrophum]|uniref:dethiobiotin synthase n=1 Tax=Desulfurobacterium thermolithotrophum TaxID=64160 RepID=UPI0013D8A38A|nr:dethiobiotin synthase [Desulfurobacterium thermolithotrophum]